MAKTAGNGDDTAISGSSASFWNEDWFQHYLQKNPPSSAKQLKKIQQGFVKAPPEEIQQFKLYCQVEKLVDDAQLALDAGDTGTASRLAEELLAENADRKAAKECGSLIYEANHILGLAAFREGAVDKAKEYLLLAGRTPGYSRFDAPGPKMTLAQQLADIGERAVLIEFLDLVARFWATKPKDKKSVNDSMYSRWRRAIRVLRYMPTWRMKIRQFWKYLHLDINKSIDERYVRNAATIARWQQELREGRSPTLVRSGCRLSSG